MSGSAWTRQIHRWTSMTFVATVVMVAVITAMVTEPAEWVFFVPLAPLAVLLGTGVYLFVLPYRGRRRA